MDVHIIKMKQIERSIYIHLSAYMWKLKKKPVIVYLSSIELIKGAGPQRW